MELPGGAQQAKVLPLEITNTHAAATEMIRAAVLDGRFRPGERLKENDLAAMLGISRTPVREAFLVLAAQGLLIVTPGRGVKVRTYTPEEMRRNYDMRSRLEAYAAAEAAGRMSDEQLSAGRESIERLRALAADDVLGLVGENARFHNLVLEAAGDERLAFMVTGLLELPLMYKSLYWRTDTEGRMRSADFHALVLDAVEAGDPEAAEAAMSKHIADAGRILVGSYVPDADHGGDREPVEEGMRPRSRHRGAR